MAHLLTVNRRYANLEFKAMIKKSRVLIISLSILMLCGCHARSVDPYYTREKQKRLPSLTIVDFQDEFQPNRGIKLVADLRKKIAASHKIPLIERDDLATAMRESHIKNPAFLEVETARKLGKRLNANLVLTGRIVDFKLEEKVINVPLLWSTTKYIATFKAEILLVKTYQGRQSIKDVTGTGEVKKRNIQLLYIGQDNNFQFISAEEKQRAVKAAYDNLIDNLVKAITT